jgi:hypothetical protein
MEAVRSLGTGVVVAGKVALVAPAEIATVPGTVADGLLLDTETVVPPAAAGFVRITVHVAGLPPGTVVGAHVTDASWA